MKAEQGKKYYESPRWSYEILDCSVPLSLDTYNICSYDCQYCFSFFQRTVNSPSYKSKQVKPVNVETIKKLFLGKLSNDDRHKYVMQKKVLQWGGLSDQFDEYERKHGVTLELLKFFKEINYPITFSTKAVWWLYDKRYADVIRGVKNWHFKVSIITLNEYKSKIVEKGCPSCEDRLRAIKRLKELNVGSVVLRLRPFIPFISDDCLDLIKRAADNGVDAVSTEFLCLERRAVNSAKRRFAEISRACGIDILKFYTENSTQKAGYMRLSRNAKMPVFLRMKELCGILGIRFYVSDAHGKELCHNGSCCGLPETENYCRGQFTEALKIAQKKGTVGFDDLEKHMDKIGLGEIIPYKMKSHGINLGSTSNSRIRKDQTVKEYIQEYWNSPRSTKSPYRYFGGILVPKEIDKNKNLIYRYKQPQQ